MIVWDTGPLVAAADRDDRDHARCVDLMRARPPLIPYPALTEVCYILERERGSKAEAAFLGSVSAGQVSLLPLAREDIDRMAELVERYAEEASSTRVPGVKELPAPHARPAAPAFGLTVYVGDTHFRVTSDGTEVSLHPRNEQRPVSRWKAKVHAPKPETPSSMS